MAMVVSQQNFPLTNIERGVLDIHLLGDSLYFLSHITGASHCSHLHRHDGSNRNGCFIYDLMKYKQRLTPINGGDRETGIDCPSGIGQGW